MTVKKDGMDGTLEFNISAGVQLSEILGNKIGSVLGER